MPQRMISQQKGSPFAYDAFEKLAKISSDRAEAKFLELITVLCLLWLYDLIFIGEKMMVQSLIWS